VPGRRKNSQRKLKKRLLVLDVLDLLLVTLLQVLDLVTDGTDGSRWPPARASRPGLSLLEEMSRPYPVRVGQRGRCRRKLVGRRAQVDRHVVLDCARGERRRPTRGLFRCRSQFVQRELLLVDERAETNEKLARRRSVVGCGYGVGLGREGHALDRLDVAPALMGREQKNDSHDDQQGDETES
jgi:hypothetical protein